VPNLYDISGSSNWFNKPDIGITFLPELRDEISEIHVQKMKYNHLGSQGMVEGKIQPTTVRFNNLSATGIMPTGFYQMNRNRLWIFTESVREQNTHYNR